jgi:hypothetical protein
MESFARLIYVIICQNFPQVIAAVGIVIICLGNSAPPSLAELVLGHGAGFLPALMNL